MVLDHVVKDVLVVHIRHAAVGIGDLRKQGTRDRGEIAGGQGMFGEHSFASRDEGVQDGHLYYCRRLGKGRKLDELSRL